VFPILERSGHWKPRVGQETVPVYLANASQTCAQPVQTLFISAVQAGSGATS
jgi:hypothetical protein